MDLPLDFDTRRAEAFAEEMIGVLNGGALALMISLGHRVGLFDVLAVMSPASVDEIAAEAGLHERYVREWLGAMVTGGILEHEGGRFRLPPEHAAVLTRSARPSNLSVTAQWIPQLGAVEDRVLACFEQGGGVPAAAYGRVPAIRAEEAGQASAASLLERLLPRVPGLRPALEAGCDVLDVGCGRGHLLRRLARAFPRSRFRGWDVSPVAVAAARTHAREERLDAIAWEERPPLPAPPPASADVALAFNLLPLQADPAAVLAGLAGALRPGGILLVQELRGTSDLEGDRDLPLAPFLYTLSCLGSLPISLGAGGAGLGLMMGRETVKGWLGAAGFAEVAVHELPEDPAFSYFAARAPD